MRVGGAYPAFGGDASRAVSLGGRVSHGAVELSPSCMSTAFAGSVRSRLLNLH